MSLPPIRYEPCVVSFIDVLGFKHLLGTAPANEIYHVLNKLREFTRPEAEAAIRSMDEARLFSRAFAFVMSDAVVRVRPYNTQYRDGAFFWELNDLLHAQISLIGTGVVIRAGLTVGDAYVGIKGDGPLFGPALARAYQIETEEAIYPRIVIDDHALAEHERDPLLRSDNDHDYEREMVGRFLATGEDGVRYLDYLRASRSEFETVTGWLRFLDSHASLIRRKRVEAKEARVARKYEWLARYHDGCVTELHDEIQRTASIADEVYEDGVSWDVPAFVEGLFIRP